MKKIKIENQKILKLLNKKSELAEGNMELVAEMEKLEKEHNKTISLIKRIDEKVRPRIMKILPEMGEYEQLSRVHLCDDGSWEFEIANRLEEFKNNYKKVINENSNNKPTA